MLNDFNGADRIYLACGYTDLRRGIDGLAALVQSQFELDPFTNTLFLFCGRKRDRIKALYWEGDGVVLLYQTLRNGTKELPVHEHAGRRRGRSGDLQHHRNGEGQRAGSVPLSLLHSEHCARTGPRRPRLGQSAAPGKRAGCLPEMNNTISLLFGREKFLPLGELTLT